MDNFESAQTKSTHATSCQPGRHPANMVIRPDVRRKITNLICKIDAQLDAEYAKLPKDPERSPAQMAAIRKLGHLQKAGTGHGPLGPRLPGSKAARRYITTRTTKRQRGECRDCDTPVGDVLFARCEACRKIRAMKRAAGVLSR